MRNDARPQPWSLDLFVVGNGTDFVADFGASVHWLGFEVRDTEGNLYPDYVATSASGGIDWSLSSVPAPGGFASTLAALAATAVVALRRRSQIPETARA